MKKHCIYCIILIIFAACGTNTSVKIDRYALVSRNNPLVSQFHELSPLTVGNGEFAYTVDATGLQTFPEMYSQGIPLGSHSEWGWHKFPNSENFRFDETLVKHNFRGWEESYSVWFTEPGRQMDAANWFRANPHRLHLGIIGMELVDSDGNRRTADELKNVRQELKLWDGLIESRFELNGVSAYVQTVCHPQMDAMAVRIQSDLIKNGQMKLNFRFPYPTGLHTDDACDWDSPEKHYTTIVNQTEQSVTFERRLDNTTYYLTVNWTGAAVIAEKERHYFVLSPEGNDFSMSCFFTENRNTSSLHSFEATSDAASAHWQTFWQRGGAVDFSACKAPEAAELERRVVLSQYLMAIQSAGRTPPAETGLTYNSWFGKFHLEMHWWHAVHFALWNRIDLLERSMDWYIDVAYPVARAIAERQGFEGVRWMKMTDPWAGEAPSGIAAFLIWQQPHFIYFAELIYRSNPTQATLDKYKRLVEETAVFMASFATYEEQANRYVLKGLIPAQETLSPEETLNPPFELSLWHFGLSVAQQWRERAGQNRNPGWDDVLNKLSPLAEKDGLYLTAESAPQTYSGVRSASVSSSNTADIIMSLATETANDDLSNIRFTSDHPAVLGALGILPESRLKTHELMLNTLNWILEHWNWDITWGWDYPMTAMNAARLGEPEKAVAALMMNNRTNTYLVNGHNYQDETLRIYLPGNGGLLTAVAMMCAGWDGSTVDTPGFPKDGNWDVKWEGLAKMP